MSKYSRDMKAESQNKLCDVDDRLYSIAVELGLTKDTHWKDSYANVRNINIIAYLSVFPNRVRGCRSHYRESIKSIRLGLSSKGVKSKDLNLYSLMLKCKEVNHPCWFDHLRDTTVLNILEE
jgi:hypothetical protein